MFWGLRVRNGSAVAAELQADEDNVGQRSASVILSPEACEVHQHQRLCLVQCLFSPQVIITIERLSQKRAR